METNSCWVKLLLGSIAVRSEEGMEGTAGGAD